MNRLRVLLGTLALVAAPSVASAQDPGSLGLTASTSGSVGIVWHLTDRVAVRPAIDFAHISTSGDGIYTLSGVQDDNSHSSNLFGIKISALLYLGRWENLRAYVAPGYGRTFESRTVTYTDSETSNYEVEGLFGLQYALGTRFAVFGETGVDYQHLSTETSIALDPILLPSVSTPASLLPVLKIESNAIGSKTRFGINFYF